MPSDAWCSVLPAGSGLPVTNRTCCFVESPFLLNPLAKKEKSLFRKSRCFGSESLRPYLLMYFCSVKPLEILKVFPESRKTNDLYLYLSLFSFKISFLLHSVIILPVMFAILFIYTRQAVASQIEAEHFRTSCASICFFPPLLPGHI